MKKSGILNAQLLYQLTKLRHQDKMVICDAGFPIPVGAEIVDVSLVAGIPDFLQVLKAVTDELIFEEYVIFTAMKERNPRYYQVITQGFLYQKSSEVTMEEFIQRAADAKLFVRTGELLPASNILLISASGVPAACEKYDVKLQL